jgi:hypothetical protein
MGEARRKACYEERKRQAMLRKRRGIKKLIAIIRKWMKREKLTSTQQFIRDYKPYF